MKLKCAILDDYQQVALGMADWSAIADRVEVFAMSQHFTDEAELAVHLQDCDILVIMRERTPITASLVRLPKLKLVITSGMRNASVDLAAAAQRGVVVCGTASGSAAPMELTWALLLGLAKHIVLKTPGCVITALRSRRWVRDAARENVGAVGPGQDWQPDGGGRAGLWHASGGLEPKSDGGKAAQQGVHLAESKQALFEQSDFVSVHLVLSERTRGLVGQQELQAMKTAYLINTSRAATRPCCVD